MVMSYKDKTFTVVITSYRCASTTFCQKMRNENLHCLFEVFGGNFATYNKKEDLLPMYPVNENNYEKYLNIVCDDAPTDNILIKVFYTHFNYHKIGIKVAETVWSNLNINKFIFLTRDIRDSYNSLTNALATGNWGTSPERKINNPNIGFQGKIPGADTFECYERNVSGWIRENREWAIAHNIPVIDITFEDVIKDEFDDRLI
jgi:hypothetical protein